MIQLRLPSVVAFIAAIAIAPAAFSCAASRTRAQTPNASARAETPPPSPSSATPAPPASRLDAHGIDVAIRAAWQSEKISPTPPASDAQYLRRAYLDIVGALPPPDEIVPFIVDPDKAKRAKLVERLLSSPKYADHWASFWDAILMGPDVKNASIDRAAFRAWLRQRFATNTPWNEVVYGVLTATGRNSDGGGRSGMPLPPPPLDGPMNAGTASDADADAEAPAKASRAAGFEVGAETGVNGAVNWALKFGDAPQDLAGSASRDFLGVQIQCAQCHDHKTEKWKTADFERFANCFTRTQIVPIDKKPRPGETRRVQLLDAPRPAPRFAKKADTKGVVEAPPTALDGTGFSSEANVRQAVARWMTSAQNPWFSAEIVNRMWGHFLGRGFVDPVDDLRPSNPAAMPELWQALSRDFAANGFDLKQLIATIAATEAYALSAAPLHNTLAQQDAEHRLWARFRVTPLAPNEILGAILDATRLNDAIAQAGHFDVDRIRARQERAYNFLFDVDEEFDHDAFEGTIAQALTLMNGSLVGSGARALPGGALARVLAAPGTTEAKITQLYLRTVSRPPTPDEVSYWSAYIDSSPPPTATERAEPPPAKGAGGNDPLRRIETKQLVRPADARTAAFEDLFWTLLNSSEFAFNH